MGNLGIIVLGQTPRKDIESLYAALLPTTTLAIRGALDGLSSEAIDALAAKGGEYPLFTILADGTNREISMFELFPLLEQKAEELAGEGTSLAVLMCAGNFPDLKSPIPIIYPGRVVPAVVQALSITKNIGIVTPNQGQLAPATSHWREKGFQVKATVASPRSPKELEASAESMAAPELELVVLDCMGFPPSAALRMRELTGKAVICPQSLVARVAAELSGE